jgi:biotin/methionine sulfoxide reductase
LPRPSAEVSCQTQAPGTDTALILALIHEIHASGRADDQFLDRYTVGNDRLVRYLDGATDGTVKNASRRRGLPACRPLESKGLARETGEGRTLVTATWALQRADHGEQPYWAVIALAATLGQIGLPGGGFGFGYSCLGGTCTTRRNFGTPSAAGP